MLFLLVGLVAAIGSRRARARMALRSTPVAEIDVMDGTQFELFCAEVLRANGYRAEHVGQSGDYGADLLISNRPGWRAVVQAKRYTGNVGLEAVQQAAAARAHYGTASAIVLTNSRFTPAARTLARSNAVDLWDRDVLINMAVRARATRSPSTPVLLAAQIGSGLAIVGRLALFLLLAIGALVDGLTSPGSSRRRPALRRRRR